MHPYFVSGANFCEGYEKIDENKRLSSEKA
jgi:hypothetical protein